MQNNVENFAVAAFRARLEKAIAGGAVSDADFADMIYTSATRFGIHEDVFRDTFGGTQGFVDRWGQMKSLPQPPARAAILKWIIEKL